MYAGNICPNCSLSPAKEETADRMSRIKDLEAERDNYKAWAKRFRDLLAPLAWLDGLSHPNETEKAIIQFDEEGAKDC